MDSSSPTAIKPCRSGFSLIELLISMTITSVILLVMLTLTATVADAWKNSRNKLFSNATARGAFERIASDFDSAYFVDRLPQAEWFRFVPDTTGLPSGPIANGAPSTWVMFFTSPTDRSSDAAGDVIGMSYRLVEQDPVPGSEDFPLYSLYRAFPVPFENIDNAARETFDNILGQTDLSSYWMSGTGATYSSDSAYLLATNIADFQVIPLIRNPDGTLTKVAPGQEVSVTSEGVTIGAPASPPTIPGGRLYGVEVSLTVLNDGGIERVRDGTFGGDDAAEFMQKNTRTYSRMIRVLPESELTF